MAKVFGGGAVRAARLLAEKMKADLVRLGPMPAQRPTRQSERRAQRKAEKSQRKGN